MLVFVFVFVLASEHARRSDATVRFVRDREKRKWLLVVVFFVPPTYSYSFWYALSFLFFPSGASQNILSRMHTFSRVSTLSRSRGLLASSSSTRTKKKRFASPRDMESVLLQNDTMEISDIFLDQFGVLHDGKNPFPEAIECVRRIHETFPSIRVHVLSNSSRRRSSTLSKLKRMGFEEKWFCSTMTSGEVCHRLIEENIMSSSSSSSYVFLHLNWGERGAVSLPSQCVLATSKEEAVAKTTHIVASGCESMSVPGTTLGSYDRRVQTIQRLSHEEIKEVLTGIARRCEQNKTEPPKMLLANPDFVTVNGDRLEVMPGTMSLWYKEILNEIYGGKNNSRSFNADDYVVKLGKPAPIIYTTLRKEIVQQTQNNRSNSNSNSSSSSSRGEKRSDGDDAIFANVLCVGDSLEHDIRGAQSVGAKSCFIVETGIHAEEFDFSSSKSGKEVEAALQAMCEKYNVESPTCTIPKFSWN